jgi:hypothetical protein
MWWSRAGQGGREECGTSSTGLRSLRARLIRGDSGRGPALVPGQWRATLWGTSQRHFSRLSSTEGEVACPLGRLVMIKVR